MTTSTTILENHSSSPANSRRGWYVLVRINERNLYADAVKAALKVATDSARENGYDPNGETSVGMPTFHGSYYTQAVWFYTEAQS